MATNKELDAMKHEDMLARINRGDAVWHDSVHGKSAENRLRDADNGVAALRTAVAAIGGGSGTSVLDELVTLDGGDKGTTTLRRKIAWLARNFRDIVQLCKGIVKTQAAHTKLLNDQATKLDAMNEKLDQLLAVKEEEK